MFASELRAFKLMQIVENLNTNTKSIIIFIIISYSDTSTEGVNICYWRSLQRNSVLLQAEAIDIRDRPLIIWGGMVQNEKKFTQRVTEKESFKGPPEKKIVWSI